MLGYHIRPERIDTLIDQFEMHMDEEQYKKAADVLAQLTVLLGEDHPQVIALNSELRTEEGD